MSACQGSIIELASLSLGDISTQDEIDAVVAYGLEQHGIDYQWLYGERSNIR